MWMRRCTWCAHILLFLINIYYGPNCFQKFLESVARNFWRLTAISEKIMKSNIRYFELKR